jgi:hypothetical protein
MKLFFLLIPFLGIHCMIPAGLHQAKKPVCVEKKEAGTYQMLPANLFMQLN